MKRKLGLLLAIILSSLLLLSACGQKDIGEAKAKEIALAYINKVFDANETEIMVTREQMECYPDQVGALATSGDSEFSARWIYFARVQMAETMTKYDAYVVASTGDVIYARQHPVNIVLSKEQKDKAEQLYSEEKNWGEKHIEAFHELSLACYDWVKANLDATRPIVLEANNGQLPNGAVQREFANAYYVVTRDGTTYNLSMSWPSFQVLSIDAINAK